MSVSVIATRRLTRQFGDVGKSNRLLPGCLDISFAVEPGESVGIVGESGSGKTTLGRCITGLSRFNYGELLHRGVDTSAAGAEGRRDFRRAIQIVFQNPETALNPRMTVGRFVAEALRNYNRVPRTEEHRRLVELAGLVGLNESHLARYPHQLSGGQKQRVGVMRALACEPDLIVLDEPTSALDVSVQAQVLRTLKDVQAATSIAYVLISHDIGVIRAMCDRILIMYLGRIVEEGPAAAVLDDPQHPYTRALIDAVPRVHRPISEPFVLTGDISAGGLTATECPLRPRCPLAVDVCTKMPPPAEAAPGHIVSCWRRGEAGNRPMPTQSERDTR